MAFEDHQVATIQREIAELNALNFDKLTNDQRTGHYERAIELAVLTIGDGNKELSVELMKLAAQFNPKGMELGKMTEQTEALTAAPDAPAEETQEEASARESDEAAGQPGDDESIALKRSIDEVRQSTKKLQKASIKIVLKIVLGENNIDFEKDDNDEVLQDRIDTWLAGNTYIPHVPIALKRSPEDVSDAMEQAGDNVENYRYVLVKILDENDIDWDVRDSDDQLQDRIDAFLSGEDHGIDHPVIINTLDRARELSGQLQQYVKTMGEQMRLDGKDVVRYNRFVRDLERISRQRLV